ncbi:hypothetical protein GIB67_040261, partial [Kingdonia uniflora]
NFALPPFPTLYTRFALIINCDGRKSKIWNLVREKKKEKKKRERKASGNSRSPNGGDDIGGVGKMKLDS